MSQPVVYILLSQKDQRTYVGYTSNLGKRVYEHNSGKVKATTSRRPFLVLYTEKFNNLEDAKKREKYYKTGAGRKKLKEYFKNKYGSPPIL